MLESDAPLAETLDDALFPGILRLWLFVSGATDAEVYFVQRTV